MTEYFHNTDWNDMTPQLQDYSAKQSIEGVQFPQLKFSYDDSGAFSELCRVGVESSFFAINGIETNEYLQQVNYSRILPGAVKAFHLHKRQTDWWFISPNQRLLVGLQDLREDSPTYLNTMRFVMGVEGSYMLKIPPGVAHGLANPYKDDVNMLYFVNQQFNPEDEFRLPWDMLGNDFWELKRE